MPSSEKKKDCLEIVHTVYIVCAGTEGRPYLSTTSPQFSYRLRLINVNRAKPSTAESTAATSHSAKTHPPCTPPSPAQPCVDRVIRPASLRIIIALGALTPAKPERNVNKSTLPPHPPKPQNSSIDPPHRNPRPNNEISQTTIPLPVQITDGNHGLVPLHLFLDLTLVVLAKRENDVVAASTRLPGQRKSAGPPHYVHPLGRRPRTIALPQEDDLHRRARVERATDPRRVPVLRGSGERS
jgi:hypothetical protein